jgi:hypothetical protein
MINLEAACDNSPDLEWEFVYPQPGLQHAEAEAWPKIENLLSLFK